MEEIIEDLKKKKVIFVEDEKELLETIKDSLEILELDFVLALGGEEALKLIEEDPKIEIIVTDINMPGMTGLELIEKVKEKFDLEDIIVMSAHTEKLYIDKAKELGVKHYMFKPFDFLKFIELIHKISYKD